MVPCGSGVIQKEHWKIRLSLLKYGHANVTWESVLDDTFAARATGQLVIAILVHSGAVKVKIIHGLPHTMAVTRMHLFIRRQLHHLVCVSRVTVTSPKWRDAITISSLHTYILLTPFFCLVTARLIRLITGNLYLHFSYLFHPKHTLAYYY